MRLLASALLSYSICIILHFFFNQPFNFTTPLLLTLFSFLLSFPMSWLLRPFFAPKKTRTLEPPATGQHSRLNDSRDWSPTCVNCYMIWRDQRNWTRCPECDAMLVPMFVVNCEKDYQFRAGGRPRRHHA